MVKGALKEGYCSEQWEARERKVFECLENFFWHLKLCCIFVTCVLIYKNQRLNLTFFGAFQFFSNTGLLVSVFWSSRKYFIYLYLLQIFLLSVHSYSPSLKISLFSTSFSFISIDAITGMREVHVHIAMIATLDMVCAKVSHIWLQVLWWFCTGLLD